MNTVICISRQFASGGHKVGEILSKKFNIPLYNSTIITECVKKSDINEALIESHDESAKHSLLYSIAMGYFGNHYIEAPGDTVFNAQADVIRGFAEKGACIIIGLCAGEILADYPPDNLNVRSIFIYADMDFRQKRAMGRFECDAEKAKRILKQKDRERAAYHARYTDDKWGTISNYDLAVSTSSCGINGAVEVISTFIEQCEKI